MKTKLVDFDGIQLRVPDEDWFYWIWDTFKGFPTCCGPGPAGHLGDILVPDSIRGTRFSVACWPHDLMFQYGHGYEEFKLANATLLENMWRVNDAFGGTVQQKIERIPIIYAYYKAVGTATGYFCFIKAKPKPPTKSNA